MHTFDVQDQKSAFNFIRNAFGASTSKHSEIFNAAKDRASSDFSFLSDAKKLKTLKSNDSNDDSYGPVFPKIDFKAHQSLIKILSLYEIEKASTNIWLGKFGNFASQILKTHANFCHLEDFQSMLAKWEAFVTILQTHFIHFQVFLEILDELITTDVNVKTKKQNVTCKLLPSMKPVKSLVPVLFAAKNKFKTQTSTSEEKVHKLKIEDAEMNEKFWTATKELQDTILKFVKELNDDEDAFDMKAKKLKKMFLVIEKIGKLENHKFNADFQKSMASAISDSAQGFMAKTMDQLSLNDGSSSEQLTALIRFLVATIYNFDTFSNRFGALFNA